jgi:uncharacterized protein (DUF58 family)
MPNLKTYLAGGQIRQIARATLLLVAAAVLALLGAFARNDGQAYAAVFLSLLSLGLLAVVSLTLIPRLLLKVKLDFLNRSHFLRFTKRGAFFVLVILAIAFSGLNTGNNLLILVLSTLMAGLIVSGLIANLVLQDLGVSLKAPDSIFAGQRARFLLTVQNQKRRTPSFALRLRSRRDHREETDGTDFFAQEKAFPYVRPRGQLSLNLECAFEKRGIYHVNGFEVRTTFPFGFFSRGREISAVGSIVVYPYLRRISDLFARYPQLDRAHERNTRGSGGSLYNIRSYQSGDNARFVDWKSTAKTSRLMVKDMASEEDKPLTIMFSTRLPDRSPVSLSAFETAVSYVGSLCTHYYHSNHTFLFVCGDFDRLVNGREEAYRTVMEYLASAEPAEDEKLAWSDEVPGCILFSAGDQCLRDGLTINYLKWDLSGSEVR